MLVTVALIGCGSPSGSLRPSPSLVDLEFTPRPGSPSASSGTEPSALPTQASWPVGWDVSFCTALTDATVAHELVIDIERALEDDARPDAEALTAELAQIVPFAANEITSVREWEPATEVKADLAALVELDAAVATAYQTWFDEGSRRLRRSARQARNAVAQAVPQANEHLQVLADMGLTCPGVTLQLEAF